MTALNAIRATSVLILSAIALPAFAASSSSANYVTPRDVVSSGGSTSQSSANYSQGSTLGQPAIGRASSANYSLSAGFWSGGTIVFTLTPTTGAAIATPITSNVVNIAGLDGPAAISVVGGTYSVNGVYTAAPGVVNNGDTVTVRQTSSSSYGATTVATLTIDGVSEPFSVTTAAAPVTTSTITGPNAGTGGGTNTATATPGVGQPVSCGFDPTSTFIPLRGAPLSPPSAPPGVNFPFGLFEFDLLGCSPGGSITVTVTYPQPIPSGAQYWKYGATAANPAPHWYTIPATFSGNTATFTLVDGGLGDDDLTANGIVVDQGGPGVGAPIPTMTSWPLLALAALIVLLGLWGLGRRQER